MSFSNRLSVGTASCDGLHGIRVCTLVDGNGVRPSASRGRRYLGADGKQLCVRRFAACSRTALGMATSEMGETRPTELGEDDTRLLCRWEFHCCRETACVKKDRCIEI